MMYPGMSSMPMTGMPMTGMPMTGMPTTSMPMTGMPSYNMPMSGLNNMQPQMMQMPNTQLNQMNPMQAGQLDQGKLPMQLSPLDGVWIGQQGETLQIQGNNFALSSRSSGQVVSGQIQTRKQYLLLYVERTDSKRLYEFAIDQGRMVLRDEHGKLLLYRRQGGY